MLRGSLSLGPTLRSGLPPYGRHHFTALMRRNQYLVNQSRMYSSKEYSNQGFVGYNPLFCGVANE